VSHPETVTTNGDELLNSIHSTDPRLHPLSILSLLTVDELSLCSTCDRRFVAQESREKSTCPSLDLDATVHPSTMLNEVGRTTDPSKVCSDDEAVNETH
jgi:hypothetical protein